VVYFSDKAVEPSRIDREQFARLAELRVQYQKSGLLGAFDSSEQLRRLVPGALAVHVASLVNRSTVGAARPGFLSTPPPYVRVSIDAVTLHTSLGPEAPSRGAASPVSLVRIRVENHSPGSVFLTGPSFAVGEGCWGIAEQDSTGALVDAKRELRPGDSTDYLYEPRCVAAILDGAVPGEVVIHDAIQRRFRAPEGSLGAALAAAS
jgi:hypothetical protein